MRKYRKNAGSPTRTDYGIGLEAGLQVFPETLPLASPFGQLNEQLDGAHVARRGLRKEVLKASAALRFACFEVHQIIRMTHHGAQNADGGRRGPITVDLFPEGVSPAVTAKGAEQIRPTEELVGRFQRSKLAGVAALGASWVPQIQPALDRLRAAATAHQAARAAHLAAFREEVAVRHEHLRQVDRIMGLVKAAFPGDRARQDVIFPDVGRRKGAAEAEDDVEDEDDGEAPASEGAA